MSSVSINHRSEAGKASWLMEQFAAIREGFASYKIYRRTVAELSALSDRELADLGAHRSQITRLALEAAYATKA